MHIQVRVFKPITKLGIFAGIKTIIVTLTQGVSQLVVVFAMLIFFMCTFAIFGMAMYTKSFRRRYVCTRVVYICVFSTYTLCVHLLFGMAMYTKSFRRRYIYMCVCVYMYMYMYVYVCLYVYVDVYVCMFMYVYVCEYTCIDVTHTIYTSMHA